MHEFPSPSLEGLPDELGVMYTSKPSKVAVGFNTVSPGSTAYAECPPSPLDPGLKPSASTSAPRAATDSATPALMTPLSSANTLSSTASTAVFSDPTGASYTRTTPSSAPSIVGASSSGFPQTPNNWVSKERTRREVLSEMDEEISTGPFPALRSPVDIPSPIVTRQGPDSAILASLDALERLCAADDEEREGAENVWASSSVC